MDGKRRDGEKVRKRKENGRGRKERRRLEIREKRGFEDGIG